MALLYFEGFDNYSTAINDLLARRAEFVWSFVNQVISPSYSSPGRNNQGTALLIGNRANLYGTLTTPLASAFLGFGFKISQQSSAVCSFNLMDGLIATPTSQLAFTFNTNLARIDVYRGDTSGTLIASSAVNSYIPSAWNYIEVFATIHPTAGVVIIHMNGQEILNVSGLNTRATANTSFSVIQFSGSPGGGNTPGVTIDDFYICDTTVGPGLIPFNTFVGDVRVVTVNVVGNGTSSQWTPLSGTNWQMVDEVHNDGDTTYNSTATAGNIDLFNMHALTGTISNVLAVQVIGSYRKDDASTREVQQQLVSGATQVEGAIYSIPGSYIYATDLYVLDPDTSANWTISAVNALQVGYKLTL